VVRGERTIKKGDISGDPKCSEVQRYVKCCGGRALNGYGGLVLPNLIKLRMPLTCFIAVRQWVIRFIAERGTTQIYS